MTEGAGKLTPQARRLLERMAVEPQAIGPRGMAVNELRRAGYAEWDDQAGATLWWIKITPEGREALRHDR